MISLSLNDNHQILKYQTSEPPLANKDSYHGTDHPHMVAIITWIGLMADISRLSDPHRDYIDHMKGYNMTLNESPYDDHQIINYQISVLKNWKLLICLNFISFYILVV